MALGESGAADAAARHDRQASRPGHRGLGPVPGARLPGRRAVLIDDGQGLVAFNNQGIEYYVIPTHDPLWFPYWLGMLVPLLAWWGIRRIKRSAATADGFNDLNPCGQQKLVPNHANEY